MPEQPTACFSQTTSMGKRSALALTTMGIILVNNFLRYSSMFLSIDVWTVFWLWLFRGFMKLSRLCLPYHVCFMLDSIDGLVNVGPTVLSSMHLSETSQNAVIHEMIHALRNSRRLVEAAVIYRDLLLDLIQGDDRQAHDATNIYRVSCCFGIH